MYNLRKLFPDAYKRHDENKFQLTTTDLAIGQEVIKRLLTEVVWLRF
jgi:hypothetical protein